MSSARDALLLALALAAGGCVRCPPPPPVSVHAEPVGEPLVDLGVVDPRIRLDLRYATRKNFTGEVLYDVPRALLRDSVARRLSRVQDRLEANGLGLVVYDAYRPHAVQRRLWRRFPDPTYVADPRRGSRHNRGAAVDVGLVDAAGRPLLMPTPFDTFGPTSHRDWPHTPEEPLRNHRLLEAAMTAEGFLPLRSEWWHYDDPGYLGHAVLDVPLTAR